MLGRRCWGSPYWVRSWLGLASEEGSSSSSAPPVLPLAGGRLPALVHTRVWAALPALRA